MDDFNITITVSKSFNELKNCQQKEFFKIIKQSILILKNGSEKIATKLLRTYNTILLNAVKLANFPCSKKVAY